MKPEATVSALTEADVAIIEPIVRQADRDEIEGGMGVCIGEALCYGLNGGASKIEFDGKVLAVFGDARHDDTIGIPWLISTVHVEHYSREFLRVCKPAVVDMLKRHKVLMNYVDVRNTAAISWLGWLGFVFDEPAPYGVKGLMFQRFHMQQEV